MSDITPTGTPTAFGFLFGAIAIFTVLYSMWYFSGGPLNKTSDKAFITGPDSNDYYKKPTVYGTVNSIDKINRDLNR